MSLGGNNDVQKPDDDLFSIVCWIGFEKWCTPSDEVILKECIKSLRGFSQRILSEDSESNINSEDSESNINVPVLDGEYIVAFSMRNGKITARQQRRE